MPCIVKCLDLPAQAASGGLSTQKVAVKLPAQGTGSTDGDAGQFADIMAALMQLPTDQLNRSLEEQFAWVSVEGGAKEWLPLIDLSKNSAENSEMIQMLLNGGTGQTGLQPTDALGLIRQMAIQTPKQNTGLLPNNLRAITAQTEAALRGELNKDGRIPGQTELNGNGQIAELVADGQSKIVDAIAIEQSESLDQRPTAQVQPETKAAATGKQDPLAIFQNLNQSTSNDSSGAGQNNSQDQEKTAAQLNQTLAKTSTGTPQRTSGDASSMQNPKAVSAHDVQATNSKTSMEKALNAAIDNQRPEGEMDRFGQAESKVDLSADPVAKNDSSPTVFNPSNHTPSPILDSSTKSASVYTTEQPQSTHDASSDSKAMQNDVIRQIVQRMTLHTNGNQSQMNIQLKPEFLGNLRMEVVTENHQVMVRMAAENHAVREMIEHNIHVLKSELEQHGLQVQKVDVYVAQNNDQWKNGRRFQHPHQQGEHSKGRDKNGASPVEMSSGPAMAANDQVKPRSANRSEVDFFA